MLTGLREIQLTRAAEAEERRAAALQHAADVEQLIDDLAADVPLSQIPEQMLDWLLKISPAAFLFVAIRVRDRAGLRRRGQQNRPAEKESV